MDDREFWEGIARHLLGIIGLIGKRHGIAWIGERVKRAKD
jgi:hypothetical protein